MANPFLIHFSIVAVGCSLAFAKELPSDVTALGAQRVAAISKIDKAYMMELEALKVKYTKAGDLETANAIVILIDQAQATLTRGVLTVGKWRYRMENGEIHERSFTDREMIAENGNRFSYSISRNVVKIDWGSGAYEELTVNFDSPEQIKGKNHDGASFRYYR